MNRFFNLVLFFVLFTPIDSLFAQTANDTLSCDNTCCCTDDATPAGVMISHVHKKNEWMVSYKYMNMQMNGLLSETSPITKEEVFVNYLMSPEKMRMDMHMLMGMYGITNRLTTMLMFNYNTTSMDMAMFTTSGHHHSGGSGTESNNHHMQSSGIGDVKLYALYNLLNSSQHQLVLSAGVNLPSGSIEVKFPNDDPMNPNERMPYSMQLGSGTVDVLPSLSYLYQKNKMTYSTQLSSVIRTGYNKVGYQLGNELTFNGWFAYQWWQFISSSIRIEGVATGSIQGYDPTIYAFNEPSSNVNNYGGEKINAYIGSVFQFKKGILKNTQLSTEYGLPIYQNVNGIQMNLKHTLYTSLSIMF